MRLLHCAVLSRGASGPTAVLESVVPRLVAGGHNVTVLSFSPPLSEVADLVKSWGAASVFLPTDVRRPNPSVWLKLASLPALQHHDVVHLHGVFNAQYPGLLIGLQRFHKPLVVTVHGNLMREAFKHHRLRKEVLFRFQIRRLLSSARVVHALAEEERRHILERSPAANIVVIPNGVAVPDNVIDTSVEESRCIRIIFVGRLDVYHKGLDTLLDAVDSDLGWFRENVRISLVGPHHSAADRAFLESRVESADGVAALLGPRFGHDKNDLVSRSDVFIHCSRYEGMPIAVLEAMALGKPCIVTRGTNMADIVSNSGCGLVCDGSADGVAAAIRSVASRPRNLLRAMGERARDWCRVHHNWNTIASQYENMYKLAVSRRSDDL